MDVEYRSLARLGYSQYEVGSDGSVWRSVPQHRRRLKASGSPLRVAICADSQILAGERAAPRQVARLVLLAFRGLPEGKQERQVTPSHIDGDEKNCRLDNLEWKPKPPGSKNRPDVRRLYEGIRQAITRRRESLGMSQTECARRSGLALSAWSIIERKTTVMHIETLLRACVALGCEPSDLLPQGWRDHVRF